MLACTEPGSLTIPEGVRAIRLVRAILAVSGFRHAARVSVGRSAEAARPLVMNGLETSIPNQLDSEEGDCSLTDSLGSCPSAAIRQDRDMWLCCFCRCGLTHPVCVADGLGVVDWRLPQATLHA